MTLEERIAKIRELMTARDDIDRQLGEMLGTAPETPAAPKGDKQRKWHKADKKGKDLQGEVESFHKAKDGGRTEKIEKMLIDGKSVAEIVEKVDVSGQTVYNIKHRLKKERRL